MTESRKIKPKNLLIQISKGRLFEPRILYTQANVKRKKSTFKHPRAKKKKKEKLSSDYHKYELLSG